ncbi:MAG: outer membrane protein insertion porin family [Acidobacteriota bacterium]|jgi:outer membrane protein assembly factor BamA
MRSPLVLAFVVQLVAHAALAQSPQGGGAAYLGKPIVEIGLLSEGRPVEDPAAAALIETRVGEPLTMAAVRESITHLFGLGRFQDVRVDASEAPGGVRLLYDLIPLHTVQQVDFRPAADSANASAPARGLGLDEGLLRRTMTNRFGASPPVGRAPEVARTLEQLYRDHGFLHAAVHPSATEKHDPDRTLLAFEIDPGPRAVVGTVQVEGTPAEGRDAFLKAVHASPSMPYEPVAIDAALGTYVQKLHKRGRFEAAASYRARPSPDGTVVDLTMFVQTGRVVTIAYRGDPLPKERLAELVPLAREGSVDEDLIEDSVQRIKRYLNQQGYWKAEATAERENGDGALTIVFTIHKGAHYLISQGVEVEGNRSVPIEQLRPALVKLQANDVFVESNLSAAVSAIAGVYQRLGYAQAKVNASENELNPPAPGHGLVRPLITITEGPLTLVGDVEFEGASSIPEDQLRPLVTSVPGTPYYEPRIAGDRDKVTLEYRNRGFESVNAVVVPKLSADGRRAELTFRITEGPQTIIDHILIIGNTRTDQRVIKRELLLQEGKPLGLEDIAESQRRLGALGLFRRFRIEELAHGSAATKDVLVTVEEAAARTFSYGGGAEATRRLSSSATGGLQERIDLAPRGFVDLGFRNIGGKNRSVDLYSRLALHPETTSTGSTRLAGFGFSEYRVVGTYREPRAIGVNADLALTAAVEQGIRSTFNFARKGVNAEVGRRLSPGVRASARYSFGTTRTFQNGQITPENQARIDRLFPQVRLSAFAGAISRDTRDDVLDPERGAFVSEEGSVAARALGGQVGFLKSYVQGFWFHRLPVRKRVIFGARMAVGLAHGFPREVATIGGVPEQPIEDLPASERFFAGGDTTIRGFALDTAGAPNTISPTGFPKGGNALLLLNGELRVPVWHELGAAVFMDGGNVFNRVSELDLGALRGSAGVGVRYKSPIGPIRFDVGFKLDRRTIAGRLESGHAFHFSIGQAF